MSRSFRPVPAILLVFLVSTACSEPGADSSIDGDVQQLTPEQLAQLAEEYPRLGTEPLPGPQPSADADPADVPAPVRTVAGRVLESVTGEATFYANYFEGRRTASGIPFRQNQLVAAHRGYPFGTILRVTNLQNDRSVNVRVVDRGPFGSGAAARRTVVDLSRRAAEQLGFIRSGRTAVRVEVLEWGRGLGAG
jgi:rare lipoprotein A